MTERPAAPRARRAASPESVEGAQVVEVQRGGALVLDGRAAAEADSSSDSAGVAEHPERATAISAEADVRYAAVVHAIELAATAGAPRRIVAVSPTCRRSPRSLRRATGRRCAPVFVASDGDRRMRMNGATVSNADVVERLLRECEESPHLLVTLEAPADARFGRVGALCDVLRRAGAESIRLITALAEEPPSGTTQACAARSALRTPPDDVDRLGGDGGVLPQRGSRRGHHQRARPLMLTIEADGRVSEAVPLDDPGYGFARAAVRCVMSGAIEFQPAHDAAGAPVRAQLRYTIRFEMSSDKPRPAEPRDALRESLQCAAMCASLDS